MDPGIYNFIINEFKTNDMLVGIMGGSIGVTVLYLLRDVPSKIVDLFLLIFSAEILITNDKAYNEFVAVLAFIQSNYKRKLRQVSFRVLDSAPTLGYGLHIYNVMGKICIINYYANDGDSFSERIKESIRIRVFTWNANAFFEILFKKINSLNEDKLKIFISHNSYWSQVDSPQPRPINTVVLRESLKEDIVLLVKDYIDRKEFFLKNGIPRKLSFLFDGPPGTGKTSMVAALATEFKLPIYYLLFGSVKGDSDLMELLSDVPSESIILIEDVDCLGFPKREDNARDKDNITLSGLLNALDGIAVPQGRILIMTSNISDNLDPALKRKGRIDHILKFDNFSDKEVNKLCDLLNISKPENNVNNPAEIEWIARTNGNLLTQRRL